MKNNKPFIRLEIKDNATGKVISIGSRKSKRIYHFLQADNFKDCLFEVTVQYGKGFTNEGSYESKKDCIFALRAFLEP